MLDKGSTSLWAAARGLCREMSADQGYAEHCRPCNLPTLPSDNCKKPDWKNEELTMAEAMANPPGATSSILSATLCVWRGMNSGNASASSETGSAMIIWGGHRGHTKSSVTRVVQRGPMCAQRSPDVDKGRRAGAGLLRNHPVRCGRTCDLDPEQLRSRRPHQCTPQGRV